MAASYPSIFVHRGLNLSHLIYDYTNGWYEKDGTQLYVNRGIGTTGFPIRLGARPEISVFELSRTLTRSQITFLKVARLIGAARSIESS
jgi:Predicted phosphohydrolases